jgi:hypothetical protein|tara:strand:+ start:1088 stop:1579 length:492 start_codon:yes stop_codon:yes gene_type:complete
MMIRIGALLLVILPMGLIAGELVIQKTWSGVIRLQQNPFGRKPKTKPSQLTVVHDTKSYTRFLSRIPSKQISRTRPAPPNKDPLLKKPVIDFTKNTLLTIDRSAMVRPVFKRIIEHEKEVVVSVEFPREFPAARPIDIGTYTAILIPNTGKPIRLQLIEAGRK